MQTLYELLDVRPDDNAQTLKRAFRRAVKATHPDANPADPAAPMRFRQVLQAYAILNDPEQRAAYEQLLALEGAQRRSNAYSKGKFFLDAMTVAGLAAVMVGGYTLFTQVAHPSADRELAIEAVAAVEAPVRASAGRTAGQSAAIAGATSRNKSDNKQPDMEMASLAKRPGPAASGVTRGDIPRLAENWSAFIVPVSHTAEDAKTGDDKAGDGKASDARAGDDKAGDGKASDAKAGNDKAGDDKAGNDKAGDGRAGDGRAGDGKAGDGKARAGKPGDAKAVNVPLPRAGGAIPDVVSRSSSRSAIAGERRGARMRDMKSRERRAMAEKRQAMRPAPASEVALESRDNAACSECSAGTRVLFGVGY